MRLRTTLLGLLLVMAVVLSGTIYLGFALHKQDIVSGERQQVDTAANVVATDIESQLDSRMDLLNLWAQNSDITAAESDAQRQAVADFVDQTTFAGGSIILPNGTMVAFRSTKLSRSEERRLLGQNFSDRTYVRAALNGESYVSHPFEADSGTEIIAFSTPLRRDGRVTGAFTGSLHLSDDSVFEKAADLSQPNHRVTVTAGNQTVYASRAGFAGPDITGSSTVGGVGWQVTVSQSRTSLTAQLREATLLQIGAVLLALLSVGTLGFWISRTTVTQLDVLIDGLDDLERRSYSRQLDIDVTDEWGAISQRYNALSETLQRRESQLQVLNRVLRHNLRNDMNVVTAHAESILATDDAPDSVTQDAEKIVATAHRLLDTSEHARALYEDLLSEETNEPTPVDVVHIVQTRVETLRAEFPECEIRTTLPGSAYALDTSTLPIVIEEMIHNAIVHNDRPVSERTVDVTVETDPDSNLASAGELRITVADNGPGIPMVEEALLTDELEETPVEHGSGLGVWLVNWLVHQLGGTVEAHSGIERGTTVTVRVPAAENGD